MQIFYIVAVLAVFVLCVALLSTARRILRSSPLASGELGIGRIHDADRDVERAEEDDFRASDPEVHSPRLETERNEMDEVDHRGFEAAEKAPEPVRAYVSQKEMRVEMPAPMPFPPVAETVPEAMDFDSFEAAYMHASEYQADERQISTGREKNGRFHLPRPSRQTYQYALECLLLGVSAYVLVRTQQSNMKLRLQQASQQSSKGRVA